MAYKGVACIVMACREVFGNPKIYSYGLYTHGLYSYGLCSHGLEGYGRHSYGLCSYGLQGGLRQPQTAVAAGRAV